MTPPTYCALLELFGGRHYARTGSTRLTTYLAAFQEQLAQHSPVLRSDSSPGSDGLLPRVFLFAGVAFVQAGGLAPLARYIRAVRSDLAARGLFLKGVVTVGQFVPVHATRFEMEDDPYSASRGDALLEPSHADLPVSGFAFRGEAPQQLLAACESQKAIGVQLLGPLASTDPDFFERETVANCYTPGDRPGTYQVFKDLRFGDEMATEADARLVLEEFLKAFFVARTRKPARHYPAFLRTWLEAVDFSRCGERDSLSHRVIEIAVNGDLERLYGGVAGSEVVYLALLTRLQAENHKSGRRQFANVKGFVRGRDGLLRRILDLPEALDPDHVRDQLLEQFSREVVAGSEAVLRATELIVQHAPKFWSMEALAEALQEKGSTNPSGAKPWTPGDVHRFIRRHRLPVDVGSDLLAASLETLRKLEAAGWAASKIAEKLNALKQWSRGGRPWTASTVRRHLRAQEA